MRETPARRARPSGFHLKKPMPVRYIDQLKAVRSGTWPISVFSSKRGRKRSCARKRIARDARRRRDAFAKRRRDWRSIAHTASLSDSANRRRVWCPGRRASCVDRVPSASKRNGRDHSKPKPAWFERAVKSGRGSALPVTAKTLRNHFLVPSGCEGIYPVILIDRQAVLNTAQRLPRGAPRAVTCTASRRRARLQDHCLAR